MASEWGKMSDQGDIMNLLGRIEGQTISMKESLVVHAEKIDSAVSGIHQVREETATAFGKMDVTIANLCTPNPVTRGEQETTESAIQKLHDRISRRSEEGWSIKQKASVAAGSSVGGLATLKVLLDYLPTIG